MCDSTNTSKEAIIVKYHESSKHFDTCYDALERFAAIYNFKDRCKIPNEPYNEFFDKLNDFFKKTESNFVKARKEFLKAKADYDAIKGK
jgi:hypothetical protein